MCKLFLPVFAGDTNSIEVLIAQLTFKWKELYAVFKHNKHSRKKLLSVLTYMERDRYELLMKLRLSDYDRFVGNTSYGRTDGQRLL